MALENDFQGWSAKSGLDRHGTRALSTSAHILQEPSFLRLL